jgi:hypothetical protein
VIFLQRKGAIRRLRAIAQPEGGCGALVGRHGAMKSKDMAKGIEEIAPPAHNVCPLTEEKQPSMLRCGNSGF